MVARAAQHRLDEQVVVTELQRQVPGREQRVSCLGKVRHVLGGTPADEETGTRALVGIELAIEQLQRPPVPRDRIIGGERAECGVAGPFRVVQRLLGIGRPGR